MEVFNILGQKVRTPDSGNFSAGPHAISMDGGDAAGEMVARGVYVYGCHLEGSGVPANAATRMILLP
jgi:flagellar hook assembly protein FlgD